MSMSVKIKVEPNEISEGVHETPGDSVTVETNSAWNGKIAIEVHDEIPGETALVSMTIAETLRLVDALHEAVNEARRAMKMAAR